ncbi:MAG: hypothetical protein F6K41_43840 [Symploca sp. SIO3E6]|nr:hypothetical protein [Caldora sp. SIO3E6]
MLCTSHVVRQNMEPSTFARFWVACNLGKGDHLKLKDELFAQESAASLSSKILEFQVLERDT